MPWFKFNKGERRRIAIFLSSLAMASLLWLFYALSNRYVFPIKLLVVWTDAPTDLKLNTLFPDTLSAKVAGSGWQLIFSRTNPEIPQVKISLKLLNKNTSVDMKTRFSEIEKQLAADQKILDIQPASLSLIKTNIISKKVPVKLRYKFKFEPFYGISESIKLNPAFVIISGDEKNIRNVTSVETEILEKSAVNASFKQTLKLKAFADAKIQVYPNELNAEIPVSLYTEKALYLPIRVKNNEKKLNIQILPSKVKVTFSTALSNYAKMNPDSFEAYVDLNNWETKKLSQLPIKFGALPKFISLIKIEPQTVDFIIYP